MEGLGQVAAGVRVGHRGSGVLAKRRPAVPAGHVPRPAVAAAGGLGAYEKEDPTNGLILRNIFYSMSWFCAVQNLLRRRAHHRVCVLSLPSAALNLVGPLRIGYEAEEADVGVELVKHIYSQVVRYTDNTRPQPASREGFIIPGGKDCYSPTEATIYKALYHTYHTLSLPLALFCQGANSSA